ncbi:MAG: GatB/YqeY domain-containing protein [Nitrospinota bacterium]
MSLKDRLTEDMKQAQRNKDVLALNVLRMVRASIKNKEIDNRGELDDAGVTAVIANAIKQRKDSKEQFLQGGRKDLAENEGLEIEILMHYLPEQVSEERIIERAGEIVAETGASSAKDIGKVVKPLLAEFKGKADGSLINKIARDILGE